jgi:hypothetical protein
MTDNEKLARLTVLISPDKASDSLDSLGIAGN